MSETDRRAPDSAARQPPTAVPPATFEKRSRYRPATAAGAPVKPPEGDFNTDPAQRFNLWIGVGVVAVLVVGAWLILSGVI